MIFIVTQSRYKTRYVNAVTGEVTIVDRTAGDPAAAVPPRPRRLAPRVLRRRRLDPEAEALMIESRQK